MVYLLSLVWRYWKLKRTMRKLARTKGKPKSNKLGLNPVRRKLHYICCQLPLKSAVCHNFCKKSRQKWRSLRLWATEHYVVLQYLSAVLGFVGGLLLALGNYTFIVYQLKFDETLAIYLCVPLGILLSIGLAFSERCRCILFLTLPQIFTGKGRAVLLAYILVVANNGPFRNAMHNFQVLVNSTVCLQDKVVAALPPFVADQLKMKPETSMKDRLNSTITKFKESFMAMRTLYNETWNEMEKQYGWLRDKQAICKKLRYRIQFFVHDLTTRLFESWIVVLFAPWLPLLLQKIAKKCISDGFAMACGYEDDEGLFVNIRNMMSKRMEAISEYIVKEGNFKVKFAHRYSYNLTQSKSFKEVQDAVLADVKSTFNWVNRLISVISTVFTAFFLLVVIKAIIYYRKYCKSPRFDNYYITKELRRLDDRRRFLGFTRLLPLRLRERSRYISVFSPNMVTKERKKFFRSFLLLFIALCNVLFFMLLDYGLHWFCTVLCSYGGFTINIQGPTLPRLDIQGEGILSQVFRGIVEAFDPFLNFYIPPIDLTSCLPRTRPPDYDSYIRIGVLMLLSLLFTIVGAYGLRLRHLVASLYNPQMERFRAVHLHRKILIQRQVIDTFKHHREARRRELFLHPMRGLAIVFEYIAVSYPLIGRILRLLGYRPVFCLSCGIKIDVKDLSSYKKCENADCDGIYCIKCCQYLKNLCQICLKPIDYDEYSLDLSEELDSSDEEEIFAKKGIKIQKVNEFEKNENDRMSSSGSDITSSSSDVSDA